MEVKPQIHLFSYPSHSFVLRVERHICTTDPVGPEELDVVGTHLRGADELASLQQVRRVDFTTSQNLGLPQQHHSHWLGWKDFREAT